MLQRLVSNVKSKLASIAFTGKLSDADNDMNFRPTVHVTLDEWKSLPDTKLTDGVQYYISDGGGEIPDIGSADIQAIIDAIYPVGSIYMSFNSTSPEVLFGGTWERIEGRFLFAADDTHPIESEGGEEEHTLMISEMPSHRHTISYQQYGGTGIGYLSGTTSSGSYNTSEVFMGYTGNSQPHNNMPPYIAVYMWRRIADLELL